MRQIFLFNPENDLAMACGDKNYTAPPFAQQLRHDLQLLPAWFAPDGSAVICDNAANAQVWLNGHGLNHIEAMQPPLPPLSGECKIEPWGWSHATLHGLKRDGAADAWMPTASEVDRLVELSHRRTSMAIHQAMTEMAGRPLCEAPIEAKSLDEVNRFACEHGECYVKSPWSSSGRGVYHLLQPGVRDFKQWCSGIIRRQGSVMCEKAFDRCLDFAIELRCDGGNSRCSIDGYSVFASDFHNQYQYGIVDSPENLHSRITALYPQLAQVEQWVVRAVEAIVAPHYTGWLGVDMLLFTKQDGTVGINPCVELNLRPTMGLVTAALGKRGMRGRMVIVAPSQLTSAHMPLTPVTASTKYCAALIADCPNPDIRQKKIR